MSFAYPLYTTWNIVCRAMTPCPWNSPCGLKSPNKGRRGRTALLGGTAHMLCQLKDFGRQTQLWM